MSLEPIDQVEKISIIFKLVQHYFNKSNIEFNIKLSITLANELSFLSNNNVIFKNINSEYLEQLDKLLKIIKNYYPKILKDLNKSDTIYNNNYLTSDRITKYSDINIIHCLNEYNEIDYAIEYVKNNITANITIVSNNEKVLNLITIRLDLEKIKYNNYAKYTKNYNKISSVFKNKIAYYFNEFNNKNLIKLTKLLSFLDISNNQNSNTTVCGLQNLHTIKNSDAVFCLSMNNETWQLKNNLFCKYNIENIFNYIVNNSKKLYCLYSSIVDGKNAIRSNILNKLESHILGSQSEPNTLGSQSESNNKCNLIFNDYNLSINNIKNDINNNVLIPKFNDNLIVLSGSDIRNLLYDPNKFYFNNLLGIEKNNNDEENIYTLFKDIFYVYFNKNYNKTYDDILQNTEKLSSLHYQKFQQIIEYLSKNNLKNDANLILNNELLETNFNNNLLIKTHCDRIEINHNIVNIKKYCLNKISNQSSIITGKETNLITQALILQNNKIINEFSEINLEIISPDWHNNVPISINKIKISMDNIKNYLKNITNALENYSQININLDNNILNL